MEPKIRLVTRADDAGGCRSANEAILEAVEGGITKNVSFMAVGPELKHAVELLGGREDICYGLHVTLNAEWERVKWGPIVPEPSLCDENGNFLPFPHDTQQIPNLDFDVVMNEVAAQYQTLLEAGVSVSYVDEHMGVSRIGFRDRLAQFCVKHHLVDYAPLKSLPDAGGEGEPLERLGRRLEQAAEGAYVWITHPGKVAPDMNQFYLRSGEPGVVARERDAERQLLTSSGLAELFESLQVKCCRYDEVLAPS